MKHNIKITILILAMFIVTQFIGLYVVNHYSSPDNLLPYGMETPVVETSSEFYTSLLPSIVVAFIFAILIFILLTKFNFSVIMKLWFFFVIMIALGITLTSFFPNVPKISFFALIFVLPLALIKTYKFNIVVHNLTELFIYPGIAAVFAPLLNIWTLIIVLILISIYDMWAVWHSGIMQKMAKYQIKELKIFAGFFIPYISKKLKLKISKMSKSKLKNQKIKANVAILGGGDIIFPIIASGVMLNAFGILGALFTIFGATLGLSYLLFAAKKKKFYPAMPFISAGIFLGIVASFILL
jgi:presenilin-like A22 family membrane protease